MPPVKKNYRKGRCVVYWRRKGEWVRVGERDYLYPLAADEFARAWPALVEKRQLLAVQRRELQVLRIAV
jgi:hypothetical protein